MFRVLIEREKIFGAQFLFCFLLRFTRLEMGHASFDTQGYKILPSFNLDLF